MGNEQIDVGGLLQLWKIYKDNPQEYEDLMKFLEKYMTDTMTIVIKGAKKAQAEMGM